MSTYPAGQESERTTSAWHPQEQTHLGQLLGYIHYGHAPSVVPYWQSSPPPWSTDHMGVTGTVLAVDYPNSPQSVGFALLLPDFSSYYSASPSPGAPQHIPRTPTPRVACRSKSVKPSLGPQKGFTGPLPPGLSFLPLTTYVTDSPKHCSSPSLRRKDLAFRPGILSMDLRVHHPW